MTESYPESCIQFGTVPLSSEACQVFYHACDQAKKLAVHMEASVDGPLMDAYLLKKAYQQQSKDFASQFLFCSLDGWMLTQLYLAQSWWYAQRLVRDITTITSLLDLYFTQSSELAGLLLTFVGKNCLEPLKELYLSQNYQFTGILALEGHGWLAEMHDRQLRQAQSMMQTHSQGRKMCQELAEEQQSQMRAFLRDHGVDPHTIYPYLDRRP